MSETSRVIRLGDRSTVEAGDHTVDPDMVEMVERLLVEIKSGAITGVAIAHVDQDGSIGTRWQVDARGNKHMLLGGVSHLQHRISNSYDGL